MTDHQIAGHENTGRENVGHDIAGHEIARHDKYLLIFVFTNPSNFSSIVENLMYIFVRLITSSNINQF